MTKQLLHLLALNVTASDGSNYTGVDPHQVSATGQQGARR